MPNIDTNNPGVGLASIVVNPGSGTGSSFSLYPSGSTNFDHTGTTVLSVTNNYPGWDCSKLGTNETLFTLKDGVTVELEQNREKPVLGSYVKARLYLVNGTNKTLFGYFDYASVFVIGGMIFSPALSNGTVAGLCYAFDYGPETSDLPGDYGSRLLRIDELVNSSVGSTFKNSSDIAENSEGSQRTYFKYGKIFFSPTYYTEDNIDTNPDDNDPYAPGGGSGTGGGTGSFDGTGDNIDFPSLPTLSAVDTGFITLFNPSASQLKALANYMWGDLFDLDTWKKIFADPMDAILGMSIVPVAVPDGGAATVTVGNISTGVSMNRAARQYVEVDCGTLNVNEYWGAYLDYDPYTKAEIYLPYIGTHPLATDDIMNKSVHVKYHIDILSGACCAYVKCGDSVMYSFVGQCSCSIPITGNDWSNVVNGALSIAASIGTMVATGGATAPMAAATIASTAVNSMKPSVEKSGSMGGMGGMLGVQTPYLILTRPRQALPARQNTFTGYPSFITMKLSDCSGYTEIESVHLENLSATEQELSEIESLLKGGVIL